MKDIPMFTSEYGVASLLLREIPYRQEAYIVMQSALQPEELLQECISFCKMVGAEAVYARNHEVVQGFPLHSIVYRMGGAVCIDEGKIEHLWPVTEETVGSWRKMMNERLKYVDNAATLDKQMEKQILASGGAYFIHRNGALLGAGWIDGEELKLLAAFQKGMGDRVLHTLLSAFNPQRIWLEVASTNTPAIRLYERCGLVKMAEIYRWHRVF